MSKLHINDIHITYQGHDLSQYGLLPLLAWYLMDVIKLPEYFEQVTVNQKRDSKKSPTFSDSQICSLRSAVYFVNRYGFSQFANPWDTKNK